MIEQTGPVPDQIVQPTAPEPVSVPEEQSMPKAKPSIMQSLKMNWILWLGSGVLLVVISVMLVSMLMPEQRNSISVVEATGPTPPPPPIDNVPTAGQKVPRKDVVADHVQGKLAEVLATSCEGQSIEVSKLPLTLAPEFKAKYTSGFKCNSEASAAADKRYLITEIAGPDGVPQNSVYIYHSDSVGQTATGNPFELNSLWQSYYIVDEQDYGLRLILDGQFGANNKSVGVEIYQKNEDPQSGTFVKAVAFKKFNDAKTLELLAKYAGADGNIPNDKISLFTLDFKNQVLKVSPEVTQMLQSVDTDINGILF